MDFTHFLTMAGVGQADPPAGLDLPRAIALVPLVGAGVQQGIELADGVAAGIAALVKKPYAPEVKRVVVGLSGLVLAAIVVVGGGLNLLAIGGVKDSAFAGVLISVLVISVGSEGANSALKYLAAVKDARKLPDVTVTLTPASASIKVGGTARFIGTVSDGSEYVYTVVGPAIATIDATGVVTATQVGTCQVMAISKANGARTASATVTIT